jgi:glycosyltransferase involved in cell wall biosynthesis
LKILLVARGVFPVPVESGAGAEAHMYNLANAIADLGHEVHYVTNVSCGKERFHKNIILHKIRSSKILASESFYAWTYCHASGNVRSFRETLRVLRSEDYDFDVIHSHGNLSSLLLSRMKGSIPLVYTVHDTPPYSCSYSSTKETVIHHASFQLIDLGAWRQVDHLIAVSRNLKNEIMKKGVPSNKISIIYNGVGDEFLREKDHEKPQSILREKYGIDNHYCLYVGRLTPRKGLDYLLHALKKTTDLRCVIVGDGPQREYLLSLARNLGLQNRVVFAGFAPQENLKEFYAAADFFVLPSLAEGLPLVMLEALASGNPIVATNVAGIPEIVSDGYNGLIVPPKDSEALSKALQRLTYDPELLQEMSTHAYQTVNERFSWRSVAKEVLKAYAKASG